MPGKPRWTQREMIQAIVDMKGMKTLAAKHLGCNYSTVRRYEARYPAVRQALAECREGVNDIAELALFAAIQRGEAWAVCFYLKTQGKERGYVERQEIEHSVARSIVFLVNGETQSLDVMTDSQVDAMESMIEGEIVRQRTEADEADEE